ncbi:uncharacterized protein LOC133034395 [Cannabis sativa]|uniref:uncharacterized protein LOC133034395 n=1 Tax=Cannabis sativa TaxID=3483 RepID=UPI0029CA83C8|nr:uncharacterized protein LOC133034395 [Cannabis sativa]
MVVSYFRDLFCAEGCDVEATCQILDCLGPPLEDADYAFLDEPFSVLEIRKVVFSLSGDKAPGLDGLNAYFYQKNWLKVVLNKIISPFQSAFVFGRVIFDNILITQEMVHAINSHKSGKVGWAALKLDMAKAFDRVDWHYFESVMFHFNFPPRGIRQGDPLSPYLFILCAEGLSALLRNKQDAGFLNGIAIARSAPAISHLFFADDSLVFCAANRTSCSALQEVFDTYSRASGILKIGPLSVNIWVFLNVSLGLSILRGWSGKCFSRAGKEVLLKAIIQAIPAYAMACFRLPVKLCKGIEAVMARFWWGSAGIFLVRPSPFLSYFINSSGDWDISKLATCFGENMVSEILNVPVSGLQDKDEIIWEHDSSGVFTVKSAYHLAFSHHDLPSPSSLTNSKKFWTKIWTSKIPPKVKELDKDYVGIFCCFLWALWNQRNNLFHNKFYPQPYDIYDWSVDFFFKYLDVQQASSPYSTQQVDLLALPDLPAAASIQLFTDAAIDSTRKRFSIGVVVLNSSNQVIAGFAKPFAGSPMVVEAKAILQAMQWVSCIHLPVDVLKTDWTDP